MQLIRFDRTSVTCVKCLRIMLNEIPIEVRAHSVRQVISTGETQSTGTSQIKWQSTSGRRYNILEEPNDSRLWSVFLFFLQHFYFSFSFLVMKLNSRRIVNEDTIQNIEVSEIRFHEILCCDICATVKTPFFLLARENSVLRCLRPTVIGHVTTSNSSFRRKVEQFVKMRSKNVLTFPLKKQARKTFLSKIIEFFPTPQGRKVSEFLIGTVGVGALAITYLPQSILFEQYRKHFLDPIK